MERRAAERYDASSTIPLRAPGFDGSGRISDLSLNGCRLRDIEPQGLESGQDITLILMDGMEASGNVCWAKGRSAGVKFDAPIAMATLAYFRFAEGITIAEDTNVDGFGRVLPPLDPRTISPPE